MRRLSLVFGLLIFCAGLSNLAQTAKAAVPVPVFITKPGTYGQPFQLILSDSAAGASVTYSLSGATQAGPIEYSGPVAISNLGITTVKAFASLSGAQSLTVTGEFVLGDARLPEKTPAISPAGGTYSGTQSVTLSDPDPEATIYYTLDGSFPTQSSPKYSGPISISKNALLTATAYGSNTRASNTAQAQYLFAGTSATLVSLLEGGYHWGGDQLNIPATAADQTIPGWGNTIAIAPNGDAYFPSGQYSQILKVSGTTGILTVFAGTGTPGFSGDSGPASMAQISSPNAVALDGKGNVYIADSGNLRIRMVSAKTGIITTVAGDGSYGSYGFEGDGKPAVQASLGYVYAMTADAIGNIFFSESDTVREVSQSTGTINTIAGNGQYGTPHVGPVSGNTTPLGFILGLATDSSSHLYLADEGNSLVLAGTYSASTTPLANFGIFAGSLSAGGFQNPGYSGDGGPAKSAQLNQPWGVAADATGNVYISDFGNSVIRVVNPQTGNIATGVGAAGGCNPPVGVDGPVLTSAGICVPSGIAARSMSLGGGVVFAQYSGEQIYQSIPVAHIGTTVTPSPEFSLAPGTYDAPQTLTISDRAAASSPATAIFVSIGGQAPRSATQAYHGPIYLDGTAGKTVTVSAYASKPGLEPSPVVTATYTITSQPASTISTIAGSGLSGFLPGPASQMQSGSLSAIATDPTGNIFLCDANNGVVWRISHATGKASIYAGNGGFGYSGDNDVAAKAQIGHCIGLTTDQVGALYIAERSSGTPAQNSYFVRKVMPGNTVIQTYAGSPNNSAVNYGLGGLAKNAWFESMNGIALDESGNLYIAVVGNVSVVSPTTQKINNFAGGGYLQPSNGVSATSVYLAQTNAIATDTAGNVYVVDNYSRLLKINTASGLITVLAGNGLNSDSGDGGPATSAGIAAMNVAVSSTGTIFLSGFNPQIRSIDPTTGVIQLAAGNGYLTFPDYDVYPEFSGDGGSAINASLINPTGMAFDPQGNLLFTDQFRVKKVAFPPAP